MMFPSNYFASSYFGSYLSSGSQPVEATPDEMVSSSVLDRANVTVQGGFPSTPVLDDFNRANGAIGSNWTGGTSPSIVSNQVPISIGTSQNRIWNPSVFGEDQEAYLTVSGISAASTSTSLSLLLKKTLNETGNGDMLACVCRFNQTVVEGYIVVGTSFVSQGQIPCTFSDGDQLGAACIGNTLYFYKNGIEIASWDVSGYGFIGDTDQFIGFRYSIGGSDSFTIDDFGGGTHIPAPNIQAAPDDALSSGTLGAVATTKRVIAMPDDATSATRINSWVTLVSDQFTDADGTPIDGRTPPVTVNGEKWTIGNWWGGGAGAVQIASNQAQITNTDSGFALKLDKADFKAVWYITTPSSFANPLRGGMRFRSANPIGVYPLIYYFATIRFDLGSGNIRFIKAVNSAESNIGSDVNYAFATNTTYKISLIVSGSTISMYVNDVLQKQETDTSIATGDYAGFGAGFASGQPFTFDSVEIQTDEFVTVTYRTDPDDAMSVSMINGVTSIVHYAVVPNDVLSATGLQQVDATVIRIMSVDDAVSSGALDEVIATVRRQAVPDDAVSETSPDEAQATIRLSAMPNDARSLAALDAVAVLVQRGVSPNGVTSDSTLDPVTVTKRVQVIPVDAASATILDEGALNVLRFATPDDMVSGSTLEQVIAAVHVLVSPDDALSSSATAYHIVLQNVYLEVTRQTTYSISVTKIGTSIEVEKQ